MRLVLILLLLLLLVAPVGPALAQSCNWWVVYGFNFPAQLVSGPYCDYYQCQQAANFLNRHYVDLQYRCQMVY